MADSTLWWLVAGVLVAIELGTGTFYLLMLALGPVAAAVAAHVGEGPTWQMVTAALVGGGFTLVWGIARRSRSTATPIQANQDANMDIGSTVLVETFNDDGTCNVNYRGASWKARFAAGEIASTGIFRITEVMGSRLILKKI